MAKKLPHTVKAELEQMAMIECRMRGWNPTRTRIDRLVNEYGEDYYDSEVPNPRKINQNDHLIGSSAVRRVLKYS